MGARLKDWVSPVSFSLGKFLRKFHTSREPRREYERGSRGEGSVPPWEREDTSPRERRRDELPKEILQFEIFMFRNSEL